jgi:hypothetical protein
MPGRLPRQDAQRLSGTSRKGPGNESDLQRTFKPVDAKDIYPESLRRLSRSGQHRVR